MRTRTKLMALLSLLVSEAALASAPVHTYSIVARDPESGAFGVAVQSHWFSVGSTVPWAEAGVGAVATQSFVEVSFGPRGLALMRDGKSASEALEILLASDPGKDGRQVALIDRKGRVAAWTGPKCIDAAGHKLGGAYSVQANLMDRPTVWPAMAQAYEASAGKPFAERLLLALEAAEREGGDVRGRQSAAILVVKGQGSGKPWADKLIDLRVEDHAQPLVELRRLYGLQQAYDLMNAGDEALSANKLDRALELYSKAAALAPGISELPYWQAVTLFTTGREEQALDLFAKVFAADPRWVRITPRLAKVGLLPADEKKLQAILARAPKSP